MRKGSCSPPGTEVTDRMLIFGERHLRTILAGYEAHYNGRRPHRSRHLRPPRPDHPVADLSRKRIERQPLLGGLINEYKRAAQKPRSGPVAEFRNPTSSITSAVAWTKKLRHEREYPVLLLGRLAHRAVIQASREPLRNPLFLERCWSRWRQRAHADTDAVMHLARRGRGARPPQPPVTWSRPWQLAAPAERRDPVTSNYVRVTGLADLFARARKLSVRTMILDVEPLVAPWHSSQESLGRGITRILGDIRTVPSVRVVVFATNSVCRPSAIRPATAFRSGTWYLPTSRCGPPRTTAFPGPARWQVIRSLPTGCSPIGSGLPSCTACRSCRTFRSVPSSCIAGDLVRPLLFRRPDPGAGPGTNNGHGSGARS